MRTAILLFYLLLQTALLAHLSWATSVNRTEAGHVGAAVYFCKTLRFDVFHVNPPLTRMLVGPAISLVAPEYDWKSYSPRPQDRTEWSMGNSFINVNSPEKVRYSVFLARCSLIPLILLGSYFGFRFATELYGTTSGFIFLTLWIFSPLLLAWSATLCPDAVSASLGIVGVYTFWRWLKNPNWKTCILAGFCLGLLPLAKTTWIIAFPIWILMFVIYFGTYGALAKWKQFVTILLLGIYTLNMGYGFDGSFRPLKDYSFRSQALTGHSESQSGKSGNRFAENAFGYVPVPLPCEFVQGIDTQRVDFEKGLESYFLGQYSQHGWLGYYAYTLGVKEPLAVWVLALLAIFVTCFMRKFNANWRDEIVVIIPGLILFIFISSQSGFSLHPRYIIPVLPFLYIWISKLGKAFSEGNRLVASATTLLLFWFVTSSLLWYPHSMSYFNEIVRSPWHGKYFTHDNPPPLLGSNIDWGQNSYFLKKWYDKHPEAKPLFVAYSSSELLDRLDMKTESVPKELVPGCYAIGVNELFSSSKQYEKFQKMMPIDSIGYSIYIYHITLEEANRVRREMGLPEIEPL